MDRGVAGAEEELCDLHSRECALDALGNLDVDSGEGEVGVLFNSLACVLHEYKHLECLTIRAWMKLLMKTNIQIGGLI